MSEQQIQQQVQLEIVLPIESENKILERVGRLVEIAIEQKIEQSSFQKRFIKQSELMTHMGVGMSTIEELYKSGLHWIPLGKSKFIDLEELAEVLESLKI